MAIWNVIMFFENGNAGWSEIYYFDPGIGSGAGVNSVNRQLVQGAVTKRAAMLGSHSILSYVRVSDPTVKHDIQIPSFPNVPAQGALAPCDQPNAGILVGTYTDDVKVWNRRLFRGCPDDAIDTTAPKNMNKASAFFGALDSFMKLLTAPGSFWKMKTGGNQYKRMTSYIALRSGTKRCGRPFGLLRGRKFVHRTPRP